MQTPAELRAMAEQAEAEAAEAEALAAAAHARARAVQLRKRAELTEAAEHDTDVPAAAAVDTAPQELAWYRRWLRRPRISTAAASLAIVAILVSLAGTAYMVLQDRNASQQRQRAAEFAAAARQGVVTLTSLDFKSAERDVQRIIDDSTGTFKSDFQKMADDFVKVVKDSQVVEQGVVKAAAVDVDSMTNDSAVVLVASESEVTNAAGAKQDPRPFRLIVTITREGSQLKMSKVQFVP
jgi:Mce-associated membrane protein